MYKKVAEHTLKPFAIIIMLCIVFYFLCSWMKAIDEKNYNNGYCNICGTELKLTKHKNYKNDKKWVYECPKCGKLVIVSFNVGNEKD